MTQTSETSAAARTNWTAFGPDGTRFNISGHSLESAITNNFQALCRAAIGTYGGHRLVEVHAEYAGDNTKRGGHTFVTLTVTAEVGLLHPDPSRRGASKTGAVDIWATREDMPERVTWNMDPDDGKIAAINAAFEGVSVALAELAVCQRS